MESILTRDEDDEVFNELINWSDFWLTLLLAKGRYIFCTDFKNCLVVSMTKIAIAQN